MVFPCAVAFVVAEEVVVWSGEVADIVNANILIAIVVDGVLIACHFPKGTENNAVVKLAISLQEGVSLPSLLGSLSWSLPWSLPCTCHSYWVLEAEGFAVL